jgi:GntR family transcriptional regulator, transcriptional repressor for pyruvate dehydrogenase complex
LTTGGEENPISRLRAPATYELVVDQLRRALALTRFVPGEKLPPERELAQQLGVSRTSVREAIRILEGEGVLEVRRGSTGGVIVREAPVGSPTYEELRQQATAYQEVLEFRLANECTAARLASERAGKREVQELQKLIEALEDNAREMDLLAKEGGADAEEKTAHLSTEFVRLDTRLHLAIARASGNRYLIEAVETGRIDMLRLLGSVFSHPTGDIHHRHREIVEAIGAGDGDAAAAAMEAHLEATGKQLRSLVKSRRKPVEA